MALNLHGNPHFNTADCSNKAMVAPSAVMYTEPGTSFPNTDRAVVVWLKCVL